MTKKQLIIKIDSSSHNFWGEHQSIWNHHPWFLRVAQESQREATFCQQKSTTGRYMDTTNQDGMGSTARQCTTFGPQKQKVCQWVSSNPEVPIFYLNSSWNIHKSYLMLLGTRWETLKSVIPTTNSLVYTHTHTHLMRNQHKKKSKYSIYYISNI